MEHRRKSSKKKNGPIKQRPPSWFERHYNLLFCLIVFGAGLLYWELDPQYKTGIYNDDALYVITAHDFWNTPAAHPLLDIKPDFPLPGLPLILKMVLFVTPHLGRTSVFVSFCSVFLLGLLVRRWLPPGPALAVVALYAFNPLVARFSSILMPDPYYRLMAIASFLLMDLSLENPTPLKTLALGVVLGWGAAMRPEGVVLLVSVLGVLLALRRGRAIVPLLLVPLSGWLFFMFLWFHARRTDVTEYGPDLLALTSFWRHSGFEILTFPFTWFRSFVGTCWSALLGISMTFFDRLVELAYASFLFGVGFGFYRLWRQRAAQRPVLLSMTIFCVAFAAVHIFWHVPDARYFVLLIPFSLIFVAAAARAPLGEVLMIFVLLLCANENARAVHQSLWAPNPMNAPPRKSIAWLKDNTSPDTKIISNIAPTIDLFAKRPASSLFNAANVDLLQYLLASRRFDYMVIRAGTATDAGAGSSENVNTVWDRYRRWVEHYPDKFSVAFADAAEASVIYRVRVDPHFVDAYRKFISASHDGENKQYQQSFSEVNQCLAMYPDLGSATNLLGALYFIANDYEKAEAEFLKTARLLPDSPNAFVNLASLYNRQHNAEKAQQFLQQGLDIDAHNGDAADFKQRVENLKKLWQTNNCELFIDFPHPSLYQELPQNKS